MHSRTCVECGQLYETSSWKPCWCPTAEAGGHMTYPCRQCGARSFDPVCTDQIVPEYGAR